MPSGRLCPHWRLDRVSQMNRTDSPMALLQVVATKIAAIQDRQQRSNLTGCVDILAGLRGVFLAMGSRNPQAC
jgi:hypothetical protein